MTPLEEACNISLNRWVDSLPDEFEPYEFSKKHQRQMKVLFNKMRGGNYHHFTKRTTIVLVAAILVFAMAITAIAIPYTREFIIEKFFDHSTYTVVGGEYSEIGDIEIGYIPEGFEKVDEFIDKRLIRMSFKSNITDDWFDIRIVQNNELLFFDTEKHDERIIQIHNKDYVYYNDKDSNYYGLLWNNSQFSFNIYGSISIENEIQIAEPIKGR